MASIGALVCVDVGLQNAWHGYVRDMEFQPSGLHKQHHAWLSSKGQLLKWTLIWLSPVFTEWSRLHGGFSWPSSWLSQGLLPCCLTKRKTPLLSNCWLHSLPLSEGNENFGVWVNVTFLEYARLIVGSHKTCSNSWIILTVNHIKSNWTGKAKKKKQHCFCSALLSFYMEFLLPAHWKLRIASNILKYWLILFWHPARTQDRFVVEIPRRVSNSLQH